MSKGLIPFSDLTISGLRTRKITDDTAKHYGYATASYKGKPVQVAPYYNSDGQLVAQKLRFKDKSFAVLGDIKDALPFGAQAYPKTGKQIVVTEGEIDALSMSQVQGNKWPVVSIGCGAGPQVKKYFARHLEYFKGFERVVLMFDMDEPGREASKAAASVLGSRAAIADLPLKDANEMLVAGRVEELVNAFWRAKEYRLDGIVELADVVSNMSLTPEPGKEWSLTSMTSLSYGRRSKEIWVVGAGTGVGKTDFLMQETAHVITHHQEPVGLFFLETPKEEVAIRLAGKVEGKSFHVPDGSWTEDELRAALTRLSSHHKVFLYDSYGLSDWDRVKEGIRHLAHAQDVRYFVVDNLTAFLVAAEDERREAERVMGEASGLCQELDCFIWMVSHLNTPEGTPHENGGMIMLRHFKGSRGIAAFAHYAIGLERDTLAKDEEERRTTTIRFIKDRKSGRATGKTFQARYDFTTGLLTETHGFKDETKSLDDGPAEPNEHEEEF
jgi:twinkle protein